MCRWIATITRPSFAHDGDLQVRVSGDLSREGNINWLYGVTISTVPPAPLDEPDDQAFRFA